MPSLASVIKAEVSRLAAKEVKAATSALQKEVAQLKREVASLAKSGAAPKKAGKKKATKKKVSKKKAAKKKPGRVAAAKPAAKTGSFSAKKLRDHRKALGLSANAYAKLVGCSLLSIYKWEKGETTPRAAQQVAIAKVMAKKA